MEIGASIDRDSIIKLPPKTIASMYYSPVPISEYTYTADGKITSYKLKTQEGRIVHNEQYMYGRDGELAEWFYIAPWGSPITEKYTYLENVRLRSTVQTITYPDFSKGEKTSAYFYDDPGRLLRIEIQTSSSEEKKSASIHFNYTP